MYMMSSTWTSDMPPPLLYVPSTSFTLNIGSRLNPEVKPRTPLTVELVLRVGSVSYNRQNEVRFRVHAWHRGSTSHARRQAEWSVHRIHTGPRE
jgi:hypothetical protein